MPDIVFPYDTIYGATVSGHELTLKVRLRIHKALLFLYKYSTLILLTYP